MNTHQHQLRADEARIDNEDPICDDAMRMSARAGRFSALAHHYAACADFEAAQRQRLSRDPKALIAAFTGQAAGPTAEDIGFLLRELRAYLQLRPELADIYFAMSDVIDATDEAVKAEEERCAEDLDAPAAARSDDAYDRKVDAGLIGRSTFSKVPGFNWPSSPSFTGLIGRSTFSKVPA